MRRPGPRTAWAASWCTRGGAPTDAEEGSERFAEGFRLGAALAQRLAGGDEDLRAEIRRLLDGGESDGPA